MTALPRLRSGELGGRVDFRLFGGGQGGAGHAVVTGLRRVLHDHAPTASLHRRGSQGGVIQRAAQHHADGARATQQGGTAEKRVGGGTHTVLPRPA
jgi:hypothetical protein